jgi:hypothetical protein
MRRFLALLIVAVAGAPSPARAQDAPEAVAEALFRDGRALMTEHRYPQACAKLAESQRLDPHVGTLLNLAACRALEGRTATAWAQYNEAKAQAARAGRADNEAFAATQLRALEPRLARVRIVATRPPAGLVVSLDGQALEAGALGTPLPVDPGTHTLVASAAGFQSQSTPFQAREATSSTFVVPALTPVAAATPEASAPPPPLAPPIEAPQETPPSGRSGLGPLVWTLGGVAVAGIGVGSVFGVLAFVRNSDANGQCPHLACTPAGLQADSDARTNALVSTVAFVVGGVAAAGAILVWAFSPAGRSSQVSLTPTAVEWSGTW